MNWRRHHDTHAVRFSRRHHVPYCFCAWHGREHRTRLGAWLEGRRHLKLARQASNLRPSG